MSSEERRSLKEQISARVREMTELKSGANPLVKSDDLKADHVASSQRAGFLRNRNKIYLAEFEYVGSNID